VVPSYNENVLVRKRFSSTFWPFSNFDGAPRMNALRYRAGNLCAGSPGVPCGVVKRAKDLVKSLRSYNENVVVRKRFSSTFCPLFMVRPTLTGRHVRNS